MIKFKNSLFTMLLLLIVTSVSVFASAPTRQAAYLAAKISNNDAATVLWKNGNGMGRVLLISEDGVFDATEGDIKTALEAHTGTDGNLLDAVVVGVTDEYVIGAWETNTSTVDLINLIPTTYHIKVIEYNRLGLLYDFCMMDVTLNPRSFTLDLPAPIVPIGHLAAIDGVKPILDWTFPEASMPADGGFYITIMDDSQLPGRPIQPYDGLDIGLVDMTGSDTWEYLLEDVFTNPSFVAGSTASYRVRAFDNNGKGGPQSAFRGFEVPRADPTPVSVCIDWEILGPTGSPGYLFDNEYINKEICNGSLILTCQFNVEMNTSIIPEIEFTNDEAVDLSTTFVLTNFAWNMDGTSCGLTYNIVDNNVALASNCDLTISNTPSSAADLDWAGLYDGACTTNNIFSVDTHAPDNPTLSSSIPAFTPVALTSVMTVAYNEAMFVSSTPLVDSDNLNIAMQADGTWNGAVTDYTVSAIHDATPEEVDVIFTVTALGGATDVAGNPCSTDVSTNIGDVVVDMIAPVLDVTNPSPAYLQDICATDAIEFSTGEETLDVYASWVSLTSPTAALVTSNVTLFNAIDGWATGLTVLYVWTEDAAGNETTVTVTVNTTDADSPTVTNPTMTNLECVEGTPGYITIKFIEEMDNTNLTTVGNYSIVIAGAPAINPTVAVPNGSYTEVTLEVPTMILALNDVVTVTMNDLTDMACNVIANDTEAVFAKAQTPQVESISWDAAHPSCFNSTYTTEINLVVDFDMNIYAFPAAVITATFDNATGGAYSIIDDKLYIPITVTAEGEIVLTALSGVIYDEGTHSRAVDLSAISLLSSTAMGIYYDDSPVSVDADLMVISGSYTQVRVKFNESASVSGATDQNNYALSSSELASWNVPGIHPTIDNYDPITNIVTLNVPDYTALTVGNTVTVTVAGMDDCANNGMDATNDEATFEETPKPYLVLTADLIYSNSDIPSDIFTVSVVPTTFNEDIAIIVVSDGDTVATGTMPASASSVTLDYTPSTFKYDDTYGGYEGFPDVVFTASGTTALDTEIDPGTLTTDILPIRPTEAPVITSVTPGRRRVIFTWNPLNKAEGAVVFCSRGSDNELPANAAAVTNDMVAGYSANTSVTITKYFDGNALQTIVRRNTYYYKMAAYNIHGGSDFDLAEPMSVGPFTATGNVYVAQKEALENEDRMAYNTVIESVYPNPITSYLSVDLNLSVDVNLTVSISDELGRNIDTPISNELYHAGFTSLDLTLDHNVASGHYFLTIIAGDEVIVHPIQIVK